MRRDRHTSHWPAEDLAAGKGTSRVSVVIPARNEEATIGPIVRTIRQRLVEQVPLVDELMVVDSCSQDGTARVACDAGAWVVAQDDVLRHLPRMRGKGEALWKGLAATGGDIVVFVDGDLRDFSERLVTGLLGPLLTDPAIAYVKGFYRRPFGTDTVGGGRVTELMARPLINTYWPELAGFVQPLAGEYGGRREVLERLPFVTHYGVEVAHLIDLLDLVGVDALAQVDLGVRKHQHQGIHALGRMAGQILHTVLDRLERSGRMTCATQSTTLTQFVGSRSLIVADMSVASRPPLASLRHGDVR
ncbi:glucosyl-3-phosphoglycerate synthase [Kibdelosporangium lantanae]